MLGEMLEEMLEEKALCKHGALILPCTGLDSWLSALSSLFNCLAFM